ncbi:MAG: FAD-dependent oxidoreductase [Patescibacteria group bacterium]
MISNFVKIIGKEIINDRYIILTLSKPEDFTFKAGQYLILKLKDKLQRTYSILSKEEDSFISFGIKIDEGLGAQTILYDMKLGDNIEILGPFGKFTYDKKNQKESKDIFIATGIGITPIKSIIDSSPSSKNIYLFWGVKDKLDLIFNFPSLGDRFKYTFSKDKIYVQSIMGDLIKMNQNDEMSFYISGHPDNVESIKKFIISSYKKVDTERIYTEKF